MMFPASAGMNRPINTVKGWLGNVPRERGDEPDITNGEPG